MDRAGRVQLRQEAGDRAARVGLTGRLGEICSWHQWRRRARRGWSVSGPAPPVPGPLPWTRSVNGTWP